jgi:hypothetical protein
MTLLLEGTIQSSLILLVGFGVTALLRGRPAALRHAVLAFALGCAAAAPLLGRAVPSWQLPVTVAALAGGEAVRDQDFAALKKALAEAPARSQLARGNGGYGWRVEPVRPTAPDLLAPVLWSAGDLVLNAGRLRIRQCANDKCLWLFVDESKSGTRRWCDMASCGNRAKARRHYSKIKHEH